MTITHADIEAVHRFREAFGQGRDQGSCFGVTDPSLLRKPFKTAAVETIPEPVTQLH